MPRSRPTRMRRYGAAVIGFAVLAPLLAGCDYLSFPFGGWTSYEDFGGEGFPGVIATYDRGEATIRFTGGTEDTVVLDRLSPGPHLVEQLGSQVAWYSDDGWALSLSGYPPTEDVDDDTPKGFGYWDMGMGMVRIDRAVRGHWSAYAYPGQCEVDFEELSRDRITGTGTCSGLRWTNALLDPGFGWNGEQGFVEGQEPFDVEIEFDATS